VPERRDIGKLQAEIEELFSDLWQVPRFTGARRGFRPAVDCYRTETPPALTIVVELAGVDPDTVKVVADERALVVSGARRRPEAVQGQVYQQIEIEYGPFQRHIPLVADVDVRAADASYEHGLLTIVLPIAERPAGPVQLPVDVKS
jgi:HSP20 family protein